MLAELQADESQGPQALRKRKQSSPQRRGIHRVVLEHRLLLRVFQRVLEDVDLVWKINQCVGCTPVIEQASRRWRGGRRDDSARTRRKILISTQVNILEDALKDAQKKTMLEDYSVDPAALRR